MSELEQEIPLLPRRVEPAADAAPRVLLIDLENCPSQIQQLLDHIQDFARVLICYANGSPKIPLDWLVLLAGAVHEGKLQIVRMANGGKNAADFGLCFYAGMLMVQLPDTARFVVVSNDYHLDHAVQLLRTHGREAERIGAPKPETGIAPGSVELPEFVAEYARHLLAHPKTRPGKAETLVNGIKAKFGIEAAPAGTILQALQQSTAVVLNEGKATYQDTVLRRLAEASP